MNQKKLRSLNWLDRFFFAATTKKQNSDNVVHPCVIDGREAIVYKKGLRERNPIFFAQLNQFAKENNIFLKEDQRDSFRVVNNDRRRKFMPMMVLGASLITNNAAAASKNYEHNHYHSTVIEYKTNSINDFDSKQKQEIYDLLQWIYAAVDGMGIHVSQKIPEVKRVNSREMFRTAFGQEMPRAMNQKNMQIYGLYNFKTKTVYLLDSIDLETEKGKSILLHELVHYVQYENNHDQKVDCKNKLENLAYQLEARYLHEKGMHVSFTDKHIQRVSQCG